MDLRDTKYSKVPRGIPQYKKLCVFPDTSSKDICSTLYAVIHQASSTSF